MTKHIITTLIALFALAFPVQGQSVDYKGNAWVTRTSRPYTAPRGLEGRHISLWSSHGRYFESMKKGAWQWQRPFLFCTTEDLLTQSFINPYLIPMLENAGAVVFDAKERDPQVNEAIVDNDTPELDGCYAEKGPWEDCGKGFAHFFTTLNDTILPFDLGSVRCTVAGSNSIAQWTPLIPASGRYAVYVSYATVPNSINDAHYIVYHAGGESTFRVNQQMGGGTWVYLGTFYFEAGQNDRNRVVLTADSQLKGQEKDGMKYVVTADAVRFGGGRGLTERSVPIVTKGTEQSKMCQIVNGEPVYTVMTDTVDIYHYGKGTTSGLPRFLEAARYNTQFFGLPDSLYNRGNGFNDYNDDLRSRSYMLNTLAGGSCYLPDTIGRKVPFELQFALHTDAGYHPNDDLVGALTITTPYDDFKRDCYLSGLTREASHQYADNMLNGVADDLTNAYNIVWPKREVRVNNYAETRSPLVPSIILELLSHQNFGDMLYAHDPNFKFRASRAIYKVLMRQIYQNHGLDAPVVQPLPVTALSATMDEKQPLAHSGPDSKASITISWQATHDPLEPSADPTDYILYIRAGNDDWDEGTLTEGKSRINIAVQPGTHYQFRVAALNEGGESFPSEAVSVYASPAICAAKPKKEKSPVQTILIVDAFDRLSGPAVINTTERAGFDLTRDIGVSYMYNASLAGAQKVFERAEGGKEGPTSLGFCSDEYVGQVLAGNRRDNAALHTSDILSTTTNYNIVSMSRQAFDKLDDDDIKRYAAIDFIAGLQADKAYNLDHYDLFTPATRSLLADYAKRGGRLFVSGAFIGEPAASVKGKVKANIAENDSVFLAQVLHCTYRATVNHSNRTTFTGLGIDIPVFNLPNAMHYPVQESTVLEAADKNAFPAFAYTTHDHEDGYSAGVAWPRGVVMGFPYDCISDSAVRKIVMNAVLNYLLD